MPSKDLVSNRKARFNYEILDTFEAGISLLGTEVKSLKAGGGALLDAYIVIEESELFLINASIAPYKMGSVNNHEEKRKRKLLMHKREIEKLSRLLHEKGLTLVPLCMYLKAGKVKVKVALAKGKKTYDKRAKIKEKESTKMIQKKQFSE